MDETLTPTPQAEQKFQEEAIGDYRVKSENGITTIGFHSVIHGQAEGDLGARINNAIKDPEVKKIVFDLKGVHTADAVAISYFARAYQRATGRTGKGEEKEIAFLDVEPVFKETMEHAGLGGMYEYSEPPKE